MNVIHSPPPDEILSSGMKRFYVFSIDRGTRCRDNERNQAVSYACLTLRIRVYIYEPGRDTSVNIVWHKSVFRSPVTDLAGNTKVNSYLFVGGEAQAPARVLTRVERYVFLRGVIWSSDKFELLLSRRRFGSSALVANSCVPSSSPANEILGSAMKGINLPPVTKYTALEWCRACDIQRPEIVPDFARET